MNLLIANAFKVKLETPDSIDKLEEQCSQLDALYCQAEKSVQDGMDGDEDEQLRIQLIISKLEADDHVLKSEPLSEPIDFNAIGE